MEMKPPKTLPLASGTAICVLTLLVIGVKAINKSRDLFLDDLTRDTSKSIDGMRMKANAKAIETISSELRAHETALQELHESQHKDSFVPAESSARQS
jgi:hypothetical protein